MEQLSYATCYKMNLKKAAVFEVGTRQDKRKDMKLEKEEVKRRENQRLLYPTPGFTQEKDGSPLQLSACISLCRH